MARLSSPAVRLRHLSQSKWRWVALSSRAVHRDLTSWYVQTRSMVTVPVPLSLGFTMSMGW
jgi:hypothetical protein